MKLDIKNQKGFSLFITVVFMSIMLSIVIGLNTILFGQLKSLSQAGNSVVAFYAADAGSEYILTTIIGGTNPPNIVPVTSLPGNGSTYQIETKCCSKNSNPLSTCIYDNSDGDTTNDCPASPGVFDTACQGKMYCSKVIGTYKNTRRVIEVDI